MGVEALLQRLLDDRAELAERVVARIRGEMPDSFAGVPVEEQRAGIEAAIELIIGMRLRDERPAMGPSAQMLREIGERPVPRLALGANMLRQPALRIVHQMIHSSLLQDNRIEDEGVSV